MNKLKRQLFRNVLVFPEINGIVRQVTSFSKIFAVGSLPQIHGKTTILPADRGTTGPGHGSFEGTRSRNGKRMDRTLSYGYMVNVCVRPSFLFKVTDVLIV
jgi:hypothetical protein